MSFPGLKQEFLIRGARRAGLLAVLFLLFLAPWNGNIAAQCAMCGTALSSPDDPLRSAIGWSVLFLIAMPFTLFGSIALWLFLAFRQSRTQLPLAAMLPFREESGVDEWVPIKEVKQ